MFKKEKELTAEERESFAKVVSDFKANGGRFVRSRDALAPYKPEATGLVLSVDEAMEIFGLVVLYEALDEPPAVILIDRGEPERTFKMRREFLGLSVEDLASQSGVTVAKVLEAEAGVRGVSIHTLVAMAKVLGLNPKYISWKAGKPELGYLYPED